MIRYVLLILALIATAFTLVARTPSAPGHEIIFGGAIITMAGQDVEAVYVHNGRIAAIGDRDTVEQAAPWHARRTDLQGGTLLPGLIEPHSHPLASALLSAAVDISGITHADRAAIMETLAEAAASPGPSPWIVAFGWDPAMLGELAPPTRAELDALSPGQPLVILTQMMHEAFANSAALDAAGLDADSPDPAGGFFERDASGALTGRIVEVSAIQALMAAAPDTPDAALTYLLGRQFDTYARAGYTTVATTGLVGRASDPLAILSEIALGPKPVINSVLYTSPDMAGRAASLWTNTEDDEALRRFAGIKIWMDGSPFVGGAALAAPYQRSDFTDTVIDLPADWAGETYFSASTALAAVLAAQRAGIQIAIHAQGEHAIDYALDAIEAAQTAHPVDGLHHRLEHLALITPAQIERAEALGVSLGFFVDHIWFYGHMLPDLVGGERTARYMPVGGATRAGVTTTLHGDHPATPVAPFRTLATSIHRQARLGGENLAPDQAITIEQGLRMMTIDAAHQLGISEETGSIEIGKRADFVWLSTDPRTTPSSQFGTIEVEASWVSGRRIDHRPWTLQRLSRAISAFIATL
jgi:predicted amidohydrolase YtcJ